MTLLRVSLACLLLSAGGMVAPAMRSGQERPTSIPPGSISIRTEGRTLLLSPADLMKVPRHEHRILAEGEQLAARGFRLDDVDGLVNMGANVILTRSIGSRTPVKRAERSGYDG